jgi:hypothetical protein
MVARLPESVAFIPRRTRMWRANQFAADPESLVRMAPSGRWREMAANSPWGRMRPSWSSG